MKDFQRWVERNQAELQGFPLGLPEDFRVAAEQVKDLLSDDQLKSWADEGLSLARHSLRSWEAAGEYFKVSPQIVAVLAFPTFLRWARHGKNLTEHSSLLAAAYFRASPQSVPHLNEDAIQDWSLLGARLYKGNWKSIALASLFFAQSPALFGIVGIQQVEALVKIIDKISDRSYELATACLEGASTTLGGLMVEDRTPFLDFASVIAEASWADTRLYFEKGPDLLQHVGPDQRPGFLDLASRVARSVGRQGYPLFAESAHALGLLDPEHHAALIHMASLLVDDSPVAAMEFLKNAPVVMIRLRPDDLWRWHDAGRNILGGSLDGGEAYFKLESNRSEEVIEKLTSRVELSRVGEILRLYCKALTGANVSMQPVAALAEKGIGWVNENRPSTEGTTVFLPEFVEDYTEKNENFNVYKVYATHQAGHLEFGSFWFSFEAPGSVFADLRHERETAREEAHDDGDGHSHERSALTDMERFFDLFENRQLISDLFAIVEDGRIDATIKREYGGMRAGLRRTQSRELTLRPQVDRLPLRQALVENLIRVTLDGYDTVVWPEKLMGTLVEGASVLKGAQTEGALVEDSAEASLRLYELVSSVPNLPPEAFEGEWQSIDDLESMLVPQGTGEGDGEQPQFPDGPEQPYDSPQMVDFRGDFKPELVQLLMRMRGDQDGEQSGQLAPLTAEQLKELLEKSVEIDVNAMSEGDLDSTIGLFLENLEKELGNSLPDQDNVTSDGMSSGEGADNEELPVQPKYYLYDEWDFRAADYKPRWCRVGERPLPEGELDFYENTLREHSSLVSMTRKQFELLRPEMFRKIKKLYDGEDIDLDEVIDYVVQRRAGGAPSDKIYWRRNKVERDVAVAFVLDMSASTDEEIEKRKPTSGDPDFDDDPRRYFAWLAQKRAQSVMSAPKRIIDLEKESIVLLVTALEAIGDNYGIYGFSGYGRDNVEFYTIKDLTETFDDSIKRRIDKIAPVRSTRMGPAIRHATWKLEHFEAKVRILVLLSDGRPQDHGYGRDRTEKDYAIHDTKQALTEAKRKGIIPFALTVDKEGHDYLKVMCDDIGYEVVADIESLPSRLPTLYRRLTE